MRRLVLAAVAIAAAAIAAGATWGCARSVPETHYYTLSAPSEVAPGPSSGAVLAVEPFSVDAAYEEPRIVYRESEYQFGYYNYHLWSAPPGLLVADYLRRAYARTGRFRLVVRDLTPEAELILGGRVIAFEEVDVAPDQWIGRLELELFLREARTGEILWTRRFVEEEPLEVQSPAGLARALSRALGRIVVATAPRVAAIAEDVANEAKDWTGCSTCGRLNNSGSANPARSAALRSGTVLALTSLTPGGIVCGHTLLFR